MALCERLMERVVGDDRFWCAGSSVDMMEALSRINTVVDTSKAAKLKHHTLHCADNRPDLYCVAGASNVP